MVKLSVNKALMEARHLVKRGETIKAEKLYNSVLKAFPKNKKARQGLSDIKKTIQTATSRNPPQNVLDQLIELYRKGSLEIVVEKAQVISKKYPETFIVWNILGAAAARMQKLDQAVFAFKKVTLIQPDYPEGFYNLGNALKDQGKLEEAIGAYKKAIACKMNYPEAFYNLGMAYKNKDNLDEAIKAYRKAIEFKPDYVEAHNNLGNVFQDQNKHSEAINSYKRAISIMPGHTKAYKNMANALGDQGLFVEAVSAYKKALSLNPNYAEVHRHLSSLIKYTPNNPQVEQVSRLLKKSELDDRDRCHLKYAYAKMNEDLGDFGTAFENYVSGGAIRQKLLFYNKKDDANFFKKIKNTFPKLQKINFKSQNDIRDVTPIFILGMPRSGTTLVEQIVSAHSEVTGAGELRIFGNLGGLMGLGQQIVSPEKFFQIRQFYLDHLIKLSGGKRFVTDKMPQNFLYLGLISIILPEARIIHVKRDPAATCWSNFKHYFPARGLGYSYSLNDTINYFRLYQDLMNFWAKFLNIKIYELNYDALTINQKLETKKLIDYLDLNWEEACLNPEENKRAIRTASQLQVRERVYKGSSRAWQKFSPYLNGIFDQLTEP